MNDGLGLRSGRCVAIVGLVLVAMAFGYSMGVETAGESRVKHLPPVREEERMTGDHSDGDWVIQGVRLKA
jgi:hypothetical protein